MDQACGGLGDDGDRLRLPRLAGEEESVGITETAVFMSVVCGILLC